MSVPDSPRGTRRRSALRRTLATLAGTPDPRPGNNTAAITTPLN